MDYRGVQKLGSCSRLLMCMTFDNKMKNEVLN